MNSEETLEQKLQARIIQARAEVDRLTDLVSRPNHFASASAMGQADLSEVNLSKLKHAQDLLGTLLNREAATLGHNLAPSDEELRERAKQAAERKEFWLRRFNLSLGIAHGAGLAAIYSKVFDKDVSVASVASAWWALASLSAGLIAAGSIPVALYKENSRVAWGLAAGSAAAFVHALGVVLAAAAMKATHVWPF